MTQKWKRKENTVTLTLRVCASFWKMHYVALLSRDLQTAWHHLKYNWCSNYLHYLSLTVYSFKFPEDFKLHSLYRYSNKQWIHTLCQVCLSPVDTQYHLNTQHVFVEASTSSQTAGLHQTSFTDWRAVSECTADKLTDIIENGLWETVGWLKWLGTRAWLKFWKATLFTISTKIPPVY